MPASGEVLQLKPTDMTLQPAVDAQLAGPPIEMKDRKKRRRRGNARALIENISPFLISALLLVVWQLIVPVAKIPQLILPTPLEILAKIGKSYPLLLADTQVTLLEVLYGFLAAVAAGIPIALCIFYSRMFAKSVYPILVGLQTIPKVALAPLLVMWFGFGILPKVVISFLIAFFPIVITTVVGLSGLDRQMVYLVQSMGASEFQTFIKDPIADGVTEHLRRLQGCNFALRGRRGDRRVHRRRKRAGISTADREHPVRFCAEFRGPDFHCVMRRGDLRGDLVVGTAVRSSSMSAAPIMALPSHAPPRTDDTRSPRAVSIALEGVTKIYETEAGEDIWRLPLSTLQSRQVNSSRLSDRAGAAKALC